jgi:hypothetical protein
MNRISNIFPTLSFTKNLHIKYFKKFYKIMENHKSDKICIECKGKLDENRKPIYETVKIKIFLRFIKIPLYF